MKVLGFYLFILNSNSCVLTRGCKLLLQIQIFAPSSVLNHISSLSKEWSTSDQESPAVYVGIIEVYRDCGPFSIGKSSNPFVISNRIHQRTNKKKKSILITGVLFMHEELHR